MGRREYQAPIAPKVSNLPDHQKMPAWLREAADELEKAHEVLTNLGVPFKLPGSTAPMTLAARIHYGFTEIKMDVSPD